MTTQQYDIILMDIQMPVMDGLEATRRIREHERIHKAPMRKIIGISANNNEAIYQEAMNVEMNSFLAKPFSIQQFNDKIASVL